MFIGVDANRDGISHYLIYGHKKECEYSRGERDNVQTLVGDLGEIRRIEKFLNKEKDWTRNYIHIVVSYTNDDKRIMDRLSDENRLKYKQQIVKKIIAHHTSGYDLDSQVSYYAETHHPKIKKLPNENGELKDRYEHDHIVIMKYDKVGKVQLQNTFFNNDFIDHVLTCYLNELNGMTKPMSNSDVRSEKELWFKKAQSKKHEKGTRGYYLEELKNIKTYSELMKYFKDNNTNFQLKKFGKDGKKITIINDKPLRNVNLTAGKKDNLNFKHIEFLVENRNKNVVVPDDMLPVKKVSKDPEDMTKEELETILKDYYSKRFKWIEEKQSKKTKHLLKEIYKDKRIIKDEKSLKEAMLSQFKMFEQDELFEVEKPQIKLKKEEEYEHEQYIYQPTYQEARGRKTRDDLYKLSSLNLLHSRKNRTGVLLSADEQHRVWTRAETNSSLFTTADRDIENGTGEGKKLAEVANGSYDNFQNMLFLKRYKHGTDIWLHKYSVFTTREYSRIAHKEKRIFIEDKGDIITSARSGKSNPNSKENIQEKVIVMLDMALSKDWKLSNMKVTGSKEFRYLMRREIDIRLKIQRKDFERENKSILFSLLKKLSRPMNTLEQMSRDAKERILIQNVKLGTLKTELPAKELLAMAVEKYNLNRDDYTIITKDNKIAKKRGMSQPKNVIEFLEKEVKMTAKEAVDQCIDMMRDKREVAEQLAKEQEKKPLTYAEQRLSAIENNLKLYRNKFGKPNPNSLYQIDYDKFDKLKISTLAKYFKDKEKYHHVKVDNMNFAYDEKLDIVFNSVDYLKYQFETEKLSDIVAKLEELTTISFRKINYEGLVTAIDEAIAKSTTMVGIQNHLKLKFKIPHVKIEGEVLKIGAEEIKLKDLGSSSTQISQELLQNRKAKQKTLNLEK